MAKLLKVRPVRQSPAFCGPAALKMVLEYNGINKSEAVLAKLSGATREKGASAKGLLAAARKLGLRGVIKDRADIRDLRFYIQEKKIPPIVDWFSHDDGHYSVAVGLDARHIYLADPELGRVRKMGLKTFQRVWFDFPGEYLKSSKDVIVRRMIVLYR